MQRQAGARREGYEDNPVVMFEIQPQDLQVDTRPRRVFDQRNVGLIDGQKLCLR
jgi:hypothetical protein